MRCKGCKQRHECCRLLRMAGRVYRGRISGVPRALHTKVDKRAQATALPLRDGGMCCRAHAAAQETRCLLILTPAQSGSSRAGLKASRCKQRALWTGRSEQEPALGMIKPPLIELKLGCGDIKRCSLKVVYYVQELEREGAVFPRLN